MKNLLFAFFLLGLIQLMYTQNKISGIVTDQNNQPLPGVQIYIEELHIGSTSNLDGYYELEKIPKGNIQIIYSYIGYETVKKEILIDKQETELNIQLKESVFHMDEVIVSTPFNKLQSENVMKVEHKSIRSLEKNGAPTLIRSLSNIPGVEQFSTGTAIGKPVIRGLTGNRVLVYTQGVRLENQQFGGEHGLGLNEAGIESVEVIKGPASLLYGSDALGGVLYFNPEKFALENETNINIKQKFFGNTLGSNTSVGFKTSKTNFKYLIRGTCTTHSDYKIPDGNRVTNTRFNENDLKAGIGYNSGKFVSELRYNFTRSDIGLTEGIDLQTHSKKPELPFQKIDNHILSLHNHFFLNQSKIDLNLGYVYNNRKEFEDNSEEAALNLKLKTFTYDAKYFFPKLNKLETIVGIQGMHQENSNFGEEILIPNAKTDDIGILTTALWKFDNLNSLQGGVRFDYRNLKTERHELEEEDGSSKIFEPVERKYQNFTASLGYKTMLFQNILTRINLASGYRAPNLAELTSNGVHEGTFRYEIGNPDLNSEQNFQSDVSFEFKNKHIEFFVNGFYNKINNYIYIAPTGETIDDFNVYKYLQNNASLYGGEAGFHFHPHPIHWLHLESSYEMVTGKQDNGSYLPLIPANKWANTARGEFKEIGKFTENYISLKLNTYFKQNKVSEFEDPSEGYNLLDFAVGSDLNLKKVSFHFNFSINNIFNTTYISHLSAFKFEGIPNMGRNYVIGVNLDL